MYNGFGVEKQHPHLLPYTGNFIVLDPLSGWEKLHSQQQMKTSTGASEHQTTWRPLVDGFLCSEQW